MFQFVLSKIVCKFSWVLRWAIGLGVVFRERLYYQQRAGVETLAFVLG
ncbi:hypothetical protein NG796_23380 [Laspinema sp. A4]|nr:hypothetical protein [Laspinema sp. D2d]MCT7986220.1 hypothetical protein [Laspinema sp. D2d]